MNPTDAAARLRESEKELLQEIRQEAETRLWHLDRLVWTRKGVVTRCLNAAVRELCALLVRAATVEPGVPAKLRDSVPQWSETGLSWNDVATLADLIEERTLAFVGAESFAGAQWLVQSAIASLKAEVACEYLRAQTEEMGRQREDNVASRHLAGRFLANASHELRTPLTAVLGFSELLLEDTYGAMTPEQRTAVGHIENSAQNLHEIVNNMLDLMQFRAGKLELHFRRLAISPVLHNVYDILLPLSKRRKVLFDRDVPDDLGSMDADEGILRHIVYNLLESSLRATPENGRVVLRAERSEDAIKIIAFDTALHFPQEAIQNMNDAFPILENSPARGYDGWEIGLPLVRRYVDLHSGTLAIESSPDSGTTITVRLPSERPASAK